MDKEQRTFPTPDHEVNISRVLVEAREERGLTLEEVEHATKIRKHYLAGLEHEDFGALPDPVYAQGFLKAYANYLGLDGEELSRQLKNRGGLRQEREATNGTARKNDPEQPLTDHGGSSSSQGHTGTLQRSDLLPRRKGLGLLQAILVLGALLAGLIAFVVAMSAVFPGLGTGERPGKPPEGVESFEVGGSGDHREGDLDYAQSPPVGGPHNPVWQNCGFYSEPVREENAVHSIEHGAVWIAHSPDLPKGQVEELRDVADSQVYALVSPYPGLGSPVVATAWGKQLRLQNASDPDLGRFVRAYVQGAQTPEPGALCTGGIGQPQ